MYQILRNTFGVIGIVILVLALAGWFGNVLEIVNGQGSDSDIIWVARIVGVFIVPLGSIMGWL